MPSAAPPEYGELQYWESRFQHESAFEWLLPFAAFRDSIIAVLGAPDDADDRRILHIGCGTSTLPQDLAAAGYAQNIVHTDFSETVVGRCRDKSPELSWAVVDALQLSVAYAPASFDVVIEKSVADAISCSDDDNSSRLQQLSAEVHHVLKPGGVWWMLSYSANRDCTRFGHGWAVTRTEFLLTHPEEQSEGIRRVHRPATLNYVYVHQKPGGEVAIEC